MKVNRTKTLFMSTIVVLSALTVAVAVNVKNRPQEEVIPPTGGRVAGMLSRGNEPNDHGKSVVTGNHVLFAEAAKNVFTPGEPIILKLTLSNQTDEDIYIIETTPKRDNEFEVKKVTGEEVPLFEKAKKTLESPELKRMISRIGPWRVLQYEVNVGDLYDLTIDNAYSVTVKRRILMQDRKKFAEVKSNPVKVVVQR